LSFIFETFDKQLLGFREFNTQGYNFDLFKQTRMCYVGPIFSALVFRIFSRLKFKGSIVKRSVYEFSRISRILFRKFDVYRISIFISISKKKNPTGFETKKIER